MTGKAPRVLIVALSAFACLMPACDKNGGGNGNSSSGGSGNTILVGEFGSMTGSEATFGQSTHAGIMQAVEEFNAAGGINGKKIEVKSYDDEGKAQMAGTVVTRLVTDDKVVAVLGEVASSLSIAGGRVCQKYKIPMISPSSTNAQVTQIGDMIFRVCFLDPFQGYACAKFARENLKATKAALLFDQGQSYSKGLKDDFAREFKSMGGTITTEQAFTGGDQDFSAQLNTIRGSSPDLIFLPAYYTDVGNVALQARKLGITVPLIGGDGWDSAKLVEIGGSAIEGCYYSNHYSHEEQRNEVQEFVKKYQAKHGQVPDALAALGYDAAKLLFESMKRSKSLEGKDLAAAIAETKDFNGVTGVFSIDKERNARKPASMIQIKGGQHRYVTTIQPPN